MDKELFIQISLACNGFLITCLLGVFAYLFRGLKDSLEVMASEMVKLNEKLVKLASNQEWHYDAIKKLQDDVKDLQSKGCEP